VETQQSNILRKERTKKDSIEKGKGPMIQYNIIDFMAQETTK
jgi:hypothetical protein